jgi:UDPglucose 6-dehydrogenase
MAAQGFDVLGVDTDADKIRMLSAGDLPIFEPNLQELLRNGLTSGRLAFTTSYEEAAQFGDVHFICVGTPQCQGSGKTDLTALHACISALAPLLNRPCLVVGKSTVPAGTGEMLSDQVARLAPAGRAAELCWNPEFLREGHGVEDTLRPDRLVVGVTSASAEATLRAVYARQLADGIPMFVTDMATAELAKVSANAFLATKISFINAIAEVCDMAGADVRMLAEILGADPRIGAQSLTPGPGFGGGCLPKDLRALEAYARDVGAVQASAFIHGVATFNSSRPSIIVDLTCETVGGSVDGKTVCVLGASFKPGSDDVRESPALHIAQILLDQGATVTVYDPAALDNAKKKYPRLGYASSAKDAAVGADVVIVLTGWPEFASLDPDELGIVTAARSVVDARYVLDPERWHAAGWCYRALGVHAADANVAKADVRNSVAV